MLQSSRTQVSDGTSTTSSWSTMTCWWTKWVNDSWHLNLMWIVAGGEDKKCLLKPSMELMMTRLVGLPSCTSENISGQKGIETVLRKIVNTKLKSSLNMSVRRLWVEDGLQIQRMWRGPWLIGDEGTGTSQPPCVLLRISCAFSRVFLYAQNIVKNVCPQFIIWLGNWLGNWVTNLLSLNLQIEDQHLTNIGQKFDNICEKLTSLVCQN